MIINSSTQKCNQRWISGSCWWYLFWEPPALDTRTHWPKMFLNHPGARLIPRQNVEVNIHYNKGSARQIVRSNGIGSTKMMCNGKTPYQHADIPSANWLQVDSKMTIEQCKWDFMGSNQMFLFVVLSITPHNERPSDGFKKEISFEVPWTLSRSKYSKGHNYNTWASARHQL